MKKLDMIVIGPGPAPPTAVIRRKSLCQQLNLKKKSKLLQVDAIRREYTIAGSVAKFSDKSILV